MFRVSSRFRSHDILPLIKLGEKWYKKDQEKEFYIMPVKNPHSNVVIRVLLVKVNNDW